MDFIEALLAHAREVADTLSRNERIKERTKGYTESVKRGLLDSFPMLEKNPEDVMPSDLLASGFGAMPLTFAGKMARHAPTREIAKAERMARATGLLDLPAGGEEWLGINRAIHGRTGIHFGVDGQPRFEIDDGQSFYRGSDAAKSSYIDDVFLHKDLYDQYPQLTVNRVTEIPKHRGGAYHDSGRLDIGQINASSTAVHELQHAIQDIEKWSPGGSPQDINNAYNVAKARMRFLEQEPKYLEAAGKIDDLWNKAYIEQTLPIDEAVYQEGEIRAAYPILKDMDKQLGVLQSNHGATYLGALRAYKNLAGEAEARAAQKRIGLSPAERAARFPFDDYDVDPLELIYGSAYNRMMGL